MVSVARWLETFTCSKYADRFERLGYSTLQSICQLTSTQLHNLGVSPADIYTIMENILLLKQSINSLNSPRYLDLTSEPPPSSGITFPFQTEPTSFNDFPPQPPPPPGMMYRNDFYNTPPQRFYSSDQQQFMYPNQRMLRPSSWNNHQQFPHPNMIQNPSLPSTNESYPHPLESLERLVHLPESQVIDPKSVVNEIHNPSSPFSESLSPLSSTPIVSNLLTNGLKRCSTNDERNELNKKIRLNTEDSLLNNHPVVTSLLTRSLNQTPLPSITSLQQKYNKE